MQQIPYSRKVWQLLEKRFRQGKPIATVDEEARECELRLIRMLMTERPKPGRAGDGNE